MQSPDADSSHDTAGVRRSPASRPTHPADPALSYSSSTSSSAALIPDAHEYYNSKPTTRNARPLHSSGIPIPTARSVSGPAATRTSAHTHTPSVQQMQVRGSVKNLVARFDHSGQARESDASVSAQQSSSATFEASQPLGINAQSLPGASELRSNYSSYQQPRSNSYAVKIRGRQEEGIAADLQRDIQQTRHRKTTSRSHSQAPAKKRQLLFGEIGSSAPSDFAHLNVYSASRNNVSDDNLTNSRPNLSHLRTHSDLPTTRFASAEPMTSDKTLIAHHRSTSGPESPTVPVFASSIRGIVGTDAYEKLNQRYQRSRALSQASQGASSVSASRARGSIASSTSQPASPEHRRNTSSESVIRAPPARYRNSPNHPDAAQKIQVAAMLSSDLDVATAAQDASSLESPPAPTVQVQTENYAIPGSYLQDEEAPAVASTPAIRPLPIRRRSSSMGKTKVSHQDPALAVSKSSDHRTFYERAQDKPAADMLSRLSSAVYQPSVPILKVETVDGDPSVDPETLTSVTEFEEDTFDAQLMDNRRVDASTQNSPYTAASQSPTDALHNHGTRLHGSIPKAPRNVLSQIMEFRRRHPHQSIPSSLIGSPIPESDDSATIQIFLGDSLPLHDQPPPTSVSQVNSPTSLQEGDPARGSHLGLPAGMEAPQSIRLNRTSDVSLAVDHFIEQYYMSGGVVSPKMLDDFEVHIPSIDPELQDRPEKERRQILTIALQEIGKETDYVFAAQETDFDQDAQMDSPTLPETPTLGHQPEPRTFSSPMSWARNVGNRSNAYPRPSEIGGPPLAPNEQSATSLLRNDATSDGYVPPVPQKDDQTQDSSLSRPEAASESIGLPEIKDTGGGLGLAIGPAYLNDVQTTPRSLARSAPPPLPLSVHANSSNVPVSRSESMDRSTADDPATPALTNGTTKTEDKDGSTSDAKPEQTPEERRLHKRRMIMCELLDTEYSYAADMKILEDIYMATGKSSDILSAEDQQILFGNIPDIVEFTSSFLDSLKRAIAPAYSRSRDRRFEKPKPDSSKPPSLSKSSRGESVLSFSEPVSEEKDRQTSVGQAFWEHLTKLETVYTVYLTNHQAANDLNQKLKSNHAVNVWLSECRAYAKDLTEAWDLDSLLVKPTQRLLKYHILLDQVLKETPKDHPDHAMLKKAHVELQGVAHRINDAKRRAELLQVINNPRKRTKTLARVLGNNKDKIRLQVGLTEATEDPDYQQVAEKYGGYYLKLQVVMRDFDQYKQRCREFMIQFNSLMDSFEEIMDSTGLTTHGEIESKWRRAAMTIREMGSIAWVDHEAAVQRHCIEPLLTVIKLNEKTQKFMSKRKKKLPEYAKFKSQSAKGDHVDRKTSDAYQEFAAYNENLKDELPKLYKLTEKLIGVALHNFVDIQRLWHSTWKRKMLTVLDLDEVRAPKGMNKIGSDLREEFHYLESKAMELSIVNGTFSSAMNTLSDNVSSSSTLYQQNGSRRNTATSQSASTGPSPNVPQGRFSTNSSESTLLGSNHTGGASRNRSNSGSANESQRQRGSAGTHGFRNDVAGFYSTSKPSTAQSSNRTSVEAQHHQTQQPIRPASSSTFYTATQGNYPAMTSPRNGVFSSAMPLPDSPTEANRPTTPGIGADGSRSPIFIAASLFEFRIKDIKFEAGFPYLTYIPGEIFDVIGIKGELWLAKNQDDPEQVVGWIWEKHFAKVASEV